MNDAFAPGELHHTPIAWRGNLVWADWVPEADSYVLVKLNGNPIWGWRDFSKLSLRRQETYITKHFVDISKL